MKWFFLVSFIAALIICALLSSFIAFALATRVAGGLRVVLFFLPQLALFGWAAREMFRFFKSQVQSVKSQEQPTTGLS